jgi:hypothetical protein
MAAAAQAAAGPGSRAAASRSAHRTTQSRLLSLPHHSQHWQQQRRRCHRDRVPRRRRLPLRQCCPSPWIGSSPPHPGPWCPFRCRCPPTCPPSTAAPQLQTRSAEAQPIARYRRSWRSSGRFGSIVRETASVAPRVRQRVDSAVMLAASSEGARVEIAVDEKWKQSFVSFARSASQAPCNLLVFATVHGSPCMSATLVRAAADPAEISVSDGEWIEFVLLVARCAVLQLAL